MSEDKKDEKKKKSPAMLIVLLVVGLVGGVGISKVMGGGGAGASAGPTTTVAPEPGEVALVEAINVNLANGHFLRIGYGAQLSKTVKVKAEAWSKTESPKVNDIIIATFSERTVEELA